MNPVVLKVNGLTADTGGRRIVDDVSFEVRAGEVVALVGASGSGKTTTGLALLGEHAPGVALGGSVEPLGGQRIGYVPQHPASVLNPVRRIGSVLTEIAKARKAGPGAIESALVRARFPTDPAMLRRFPHQLSGGQQQRLVLAQALLTDPAVIVADEPTTGQDPATRAELVGELADLAAHGVAIVLLTHDLAAVRDLAARVVVLYGGRIVESGPVSVLTHPEHEYTRSLVAAGEIRPRAAPTPTEPLLRITGLSARHRKTYVLSEVDLTVGAGECVAVVGRSGSGKTTLARCVVGLHPPASGRITLDGRDLPAGTHRRSRADLAAVQYVFQDAKASFDPYRPVADQVARTAVLLRGMSTSDARRAASAVFDSVGLTAQVVARRPASLSGGEAQRATLARALLADPRVLVCDEITSGLDAVTEAGILDLLAGLGRAVVLISHDPTVVARLADRVLTIDNGRISP